MLKFVTKYVIGGRSGKREAAWFVFLLWVAAFGWAAWREAYGLHVQGTQGLLSTTFLPVLGFLLASYGMEWIGSQTDWGGEKLPEREHDPFPPMGEAEGPG